MNCDKSSRLKLIRLGGVIFLLILIVIRFNLGQNTRATQFLPDFLLKFFLILKQRINFGLNKIIPEPQLSLMKSLFFGGKANLPFELKKQIRQVGLSHLIAVSGLHLTIVTQIVSTCLNALLLTGFLNFLFSVFFILGFVVMADFSASVVRAAIMAILLLIARLNHRLYNSSFALIFAVLFMVFLNPKIIIEDFGFQLSVLATLGIVYFYPVLEKWPFWQKDIFKSQLAFLKETMLLSFSALLFVAPWIIYQTQVFSLVTPLTNILIVPLVPIIMILGFLVALLSFIFFPLAFLLGFCLNFLLSYMMAVIKIFSSWRMSEILFPSLALSWLIFYYLLLIYYLKCRNHLRSF
ncbi:ComEC/Rec2 family competence protein [Candidatus Parcubacteria bacterium]|nr:ComEC/Rec2 family competence protein [Candidatus Parcubacteria bacterium]